MVAYRSLSEVPVGQSQPKAVPGKAAFTAEWNGAKWAFATAANRDKFMADPAKYAPGYDGHCAYGVSLKGKVPGNSNLWQIVDGQLLLKITTKVVEFWEADISGNLVKAEANWPGLEANAAAGKAVPKLDISMALKG